MNRLRSAAQTLLRWRRDPASMVREEFHAEPDAFQLELLEAFADPAQRRIAMKASKGPGKTTGLAWCILNFMACYGDRHNHPKGAATGISEKNLDDNLWPEIAKWMHRSEFFKEAFLWSKDRISARDFPEDWFFSKKTWSKKADQQQQSDTLAGFHADWVLFVVDESASVPDAIVATAEAALMAPWAKLLQAGNPTQLSGPLYTACTKHRKFWTVITINGDPDNPKRASRVSIEWARQQIELYGRDNPWVIVNVFGEFPPGSLNTLLGPDEVDAAMARYSQIKKSDYNWSQRRLGIDVARFGDDRTVIFPRQGMLASKPVELRQADTVAIAARVMLAEQRFSKSGRDEVVMLIDDTGHWGHGVYDNLRAAGRTAIPIQFHAPAIDPRYRNRRAEGWLQMANWVRERGALPPIMGLVPELTVPEYTFSNGKFVLQEKDQIKEKLGYSPDLADALALTFMLPEMPGGAGAAGFGEGIRLPELIASGGAGRLAHDFDPLERFREETD